MNNLLIIIDIEGVIDNVTKVNEYNKSLERLFLVLNELKNKTLSKEVVISLISNSEDLDYITSIKNQIYPLVDSSSSIRLGKQIYGQRSTIGLGGNIVLEFKNTEYESKVLSLIQKQKAKNVIYVSNLSYNDHSLSGANKVTNNSSNNYVLLLGTSTSITTKNIVWATEQNIDGLVLGLHLLKEQIKVSTKPLDDNIREAIADLKDFAKSSTNTSISSIQKTKSYKS